jgi:hypothetical protein
MKTLQAFIDRTNSWRQIFGDELVSTHVRRLTQKDADDLFEEISAGLSPENLCCDGEASAAHIKIESRLLNKAKRELLDLGFTPTNNDY